MDIKKISKDLITKEKLANYSFLIAFFLLFAFFILVAIKPNLEKAFSLQKELAELKVLDEQYDVAITQIIDIQNTLTANRDQLTLVKQALPENPEVNKIFADLQKSASLSKVPVTGLSVAEVELKNQQVDHSTMKNYVIRFESESPFESIQGFINDFLAQRRLKLVNKLEISKDEEASGSAGLGVSLEVAGHYL